MLGKHLKCTAPSTTTKTLKCTAKQIKFSVRLSYTKFVEKVKKQHNTAPVVCWNPHDQQPHLHQVLEYSLQAAKKEDQPRFIQC